MPKKILEILIEQKYITEEQREKILQHQRRYGGKVGGHLLALGYLNPKQLSKGLSIKFNCPEIDPLVLKNIDRNLINEFPIKLARKYLCLPLIRVNKVLSIAISNPNDKEALKKIEFGTGYQIRPYVAPDALLREMIMKYYNLDRSFIDTERSPADAGTDISDEESTDIESFIPQNELFISSDEYSEISDEEIYQLVVEPSDPLIEELIKSRSVYEFSNLAIDNLFIGLNRIIILEIHEKAIKPIVSKGWVRDQGMSDEVNFPINPSSINYNLLLQKDLFYGPIDRIAIADLAYYLIGDVRENLENFYTLFGYLTFGNRMLYLIYADLNGQPIPEQYIQTWRELLPKIQEGFNHLLPRL